MRYLRQIACRHLQDIIRSGSSASIDVVRRGTMPLKVIHSSSNITTHLVVVVTLVLLFVVGQNVAIV